MTKTTTVVVAEKVRRAPVLTAATLAATVACTTTRVWTTTVMHALWRDPTALRHGQVWRLLTPVLVQSDRSVVNVVGVFLLCAAVGVIGEQHFTGPAWCGLYLAGAVSGHAVGMVFQPHQSGTSVAFAGVLGGLGALAISGRAPELYRWRFHAPRWRSWRLSIPRSATSTGWPTWPVWPSPVW